MPLYEAREAGVWIVAADTAYAREALEGYPFVAWFAPTDPEALADAMSKAWSASREARPRIVDLKARDDGWDRMINELTRLFKPPKPSRIFEQEDRSTEDG